MTLKTFPFIRKWDCESHSALPQGFLCPVGLQIVQLIGLHAELSLSLEPASVVRRANHVGAGAKVRKGSS